MPNFPIKSFLNFLILINVIGTGSAAADWVFLTNGDRISGELLSFSSAEVMISTPHSGILRFSRPWIDKITTDQKMVVDFLSGERLIGRIQTEAGGRLVLQSERFGNWAFSLDGVASISPLEPKGADQGGTPFPHAFFAGEGDQRNLQVPKETGAGSLTAIRGKGTESRPNPDPSRQQGPGGISASQTIGQKPEEEDIRKLFLRQSSVLLRPGQVEMETGLNYTGTQSVSAVLNVKLRQFQLPIAVRFGLLDRLESFLSWAYVFNRQSFSFAESATTKSKNGFGDTALGINYEIFQEQAGWPEVITQIRVKAPTGEPPQPDGLSLGSGHWSASLGLQCIKTLDPVVLFWGLQYTHEFSARHYFNDGFYDVQPGKIVGYNLGLGFAVNEKVSLGAQVQGSYQWDTKLDGRTIPGSASEPVSFRSALTYRWSKKAFFESSVSMGLNEDAPDFSLGFTATRRF